MTMKTLECFALVAKLRSFSKAARKLFLTPPAVTQQINALESELEFKLFDRGSKGVTLTKAGESFLRDTEVILASLSCALTRGRAIAAGISKLRIGVWGGSCHILIPAICSEFLETYPDVELEFASTDGDDYMAMIRNGVIDAYIAFGVMGVAEAGLRAITLFFESPQCMIPVRSDLAKLDKVSFSDLRGRRLVIPLLGRSAYHDHTREYIRAHEPDIELIDVSAHNSGLMQMQMLDAVALCPPTLAECGSQFVLRPFEREALTSIDLITHDVDNALLNAFISAAQHAVKQLGSA